VRFGNPDAGSPFPPNPPHDSSGNAKDNLIPRTVVISAGGSVTFEMPARHKPAVYRDGTVPTSINITPAPPAPGCPPIATVNDPNGRLFHTTNCPAVGSLVPTPPGTFATPGRYLVICELRPHFVDNDMYGWVIVQ